MIEPSDPGPTRANFIEAFEQATSEQLDELLFCWTSQPKFTRYFKTSLMPRIAVLLHCDMETEYNRVDVVLKSGERIVAAIEHENNFSGSASSEVVKLKNFNAPLGVLITYISEQQRSRMLQEYNSVLKPSDHASSASRSGDIIIVVGPYGMNPPAFLKWTYYGYSEDALVLLP